MNFYEMQIQVYKDYLENPPEEPTEVIESIQHKIKALNFLAAANKEERLELFDSGAFNNVVRGYIQMAIDNLEIEEETEKALFKELHYLFDTVTASKAEDYYRNH